MPRRHRERDAPWPDRIAMAQTVIDATFEAAESTMRTFGGSPPMPTVHVFTEHVTAQPYAGFMSARPPAVGRHTMASVAGLGLLPLALAATRVVIVWEQADLETSLHGPDCAHINALVAVEATHDAHTVVIKPFTTRWERTDAAVSGRRCLPHFGPARTLSAGPLPAPIIDALALWRTNPTPDATRKAALLSTLASLGYHVRLTTPA
jgi:hypothetical protein